METMILSIIGQGQGQGRKAIETWDGQGENNNHEKWDEQGWKQ